LQEKEDAFIRAKNERRFETTAGTTFVEQDLTANIVGKKVMKTQDGKGVDLPDEQLLVEHGMINRSSHVTDEEIRTLIPAGDYSQV
jgi:hypothetical protein